MLQLTYISTAVAGVDDAAARKILDASCRNNAQAGVSGLLIFDGRRFLQALEGPALDVQRTFARIGRDARHRGIVLLSEREVKAREFGAWAMAWRRVHEAPGTTSVPQVVDALVQFVPDANTRALFSGFARLRHAA